MRNHQLPKSFLLLLYGCLVMLFLNGIPLARELRSGTPPKWMYWASLGSYFLAILRLGMNAGMFHFWTSSSKRWSAQTGSSMFFWWCQNWSDLVSDVRRDPSRCGWRLRMVCNPLQFLDIYESWSHKWKEKRCHTLLVAQTSKANLSGFFKSSVFSFTFGSWICSVFRRYRPQVRKSVFAKRTPIEDFK